MHRLIRQSLTADLEETASAEIASPQKRSDVHAEADSAAVPGVLKRIERGLIVSNRDAMDQ